MFMLRNQVTATSQSILPLLYHPLLLRDIITVALLYHLLLLRINHGRESITATLVLLYRLLRYLFAGTYPLRYLFAGIRL